jgi:hypothetical protein
VAVIPCSFCCFSVSAQHTWDCHAEKDSLNFQEKRLFEMLARLAESGFFIVDYHMLFGDVCRLILGGCGKQGKKNVLAVTTI